MKINVNVNRTYKVNGKEYKSLEEMPEDIRKLFEKAISGEPETLQATHTTTKTKIVFNGQEYDSIDKMPTFARNLYEQALKAAQGTAGKVETEHVTALTGPRPTVTEESSFSVRSLLLGGGIILLAVLAWYLLHSR